jgi:hypothetical protein
MSFCSTFDSLALVLGIHLEKQINKIQTLSQSEAKTSSRKLRRKLFFLNSKTSTQRLKNWRAAAAADIESALESLCKLHKHTNDAEQGRRRTAPSYFLLFSAVSDAEEQRGLREVEVELINIHLVEIELSAQREESLKMSISRRHHRRYSSFFAYLPSECIRRYPQILTESISSGFFHVSPVPMNLQPLSLAPCL